MNTKWIKLGITGLLLVFAITMAACGDPHAVSADKKVQDEQERMQKEGESQAGLPRIKNFRELKLVNYLYELRDQDGLVTYTYLENERPQVVQGKTALAGKLTFVGESVGYGIPFATQRSNPQKATWGDNHGWLVLPQSEPNGLFTPGSAEGTWVILKDPNGKDAKPVYFEPRIVVSPFKFPSD